MIDFKDSPIRSVCVYCGSLPGKDPEFMAAASGLGWAVAQAGVSLIYGGGNRGLMGAVARATLRGEGSLLGVIPEFLVETEQPDEEGDLDGAEMIQVADMHSRKNVMFEQADAFVALPGGIGTLEEVVEMMTWAQLGRHEKPVVLLNTNGFWNPFIELIDHMEEIGFLHNRDAARPWVCDTPAEVVSLLVPDQD